MCYEPNKPVVDSPAFAIKKAKIAKNTLNTKFPTISIAAPILQFL